MFLYDKKPSLTIAIDRPDPKTYFLLDSKLHGTKNGIEQSMLYIRQAFMIHNATFCETFKRLGAKLLNDMEVLAELIHLEHGVDDRYYDESNDDTPAFEYIMSTEKQSSIMCDKPQDRHVNNDLTAAVMHDIQFEDQRIQQYESLLEQLQDQGVQKVFQYLIDSAKRSKDILGNLLEILTTHVELKEFGEGDTHESWDLDTSNYFDKHNPYFLTPDDKEVK